MSLALRTVASKRERSKYWVKIVYFLFFEKYYLAKHELQVDRHTIFQEFLELLWRLFPNRLPNHELRTKKTKKLKNAFQKLIKKINSNQFFHMQSKNWEFWHDDVPCHICLSEEELEVLLQSYGRFIRWKKNTSTKKE